jgi:hypothetical protein
MFWMKLFKVNLADAKTAKHRAPQRPPEHGPERMLDGNPASYWVAQNGTVAPWVEIDLGTEAVFNRSMLQEHVALGQRIENTSSRRGTRAAGGRS